MEKLVWISYGDNMRSDTFYGGFTVKLVRRLSGNLIYHAFSTNRESSIQIE